MSSKRWATSIPPLHKAALATPTRGSAAAGDAGDVDPYSDAVGSSRSAVSRSRTRSTASARPSSRAHSKSAGLKRSSAGLRASDPYGVVDGAGDKVNPVSSSVTTGQRNKELLALAINPRSIPSSITANRRRLRA